MNILIIEDDLKLRTLLERYLQHEGYEVATASDGLEGISTFKALSIDIVICDIRLPGISGMEVLRRLTAEYSLHPPILLITGHGDKPMAIEAIRLGAFDFLEKPFTPEKLKEAVVRAQEKKRADILGFRALDIRSGEMVELTAREREVARLVTEGLTNEEIAKRLLIASETVKFHLKSIFRKVGVQNRVNLASKLRAA